MRTATADFIRSAFGLHRVLLSRRPQTNQHTHAIQLDRAIQLTLLRIQTNLLSFYSHLPSTLCPHCHGNESINSADRLTIIAPWWPWLNDFLSLFFAQAKSIRLFIFAQQSSQLVHESFADEWLAMCTARIVYIMMLALRFMAAILASEITLNHSNGQAIRLV